jgi:hypothetical protein
MSSLLWQLPGTHTGTLSLHGKPRQKHFPLHPNTRFLKSLTSSSGNYLPHDRIRHQGLTPHANQAFGASLLTLARSKLGSRASIQHEAAS